LSGVEDILKKLEQCDFEIGGYSTEASDRLKEIVNLVKNLTKENRGKALKMVNEMLSQMEPYEFYIPTSVENFRAIKEWLDKQK